MGIRLNNQQMIGKTFGYLTVFSVRRERISNKTRVIYKCKCKCGSIIEVRRQNLLKPGLHSCGCARKEIADKYLSKNIDNQKFGRLTVIHQNKEKTPRTVICKCDCGNYTQVSKTDLMSGHVYSCGCLKKQRISESNTKDYSGYVSKYGVQIGKKVCKNKHNVWQYECKCPLCGNTFIEIPSYIISGHTKSCGCMISSGEKIIRDYLNSHNVQFEQQYTFEDCKYKNELRFDFAVFKQKDGKPILIEYDGKQHFVPIDFFGGEQSFYITKTRDKIKDEYCLQNNYQLIRIPYTETDDEIEKILNDIIAP